MSQSKVIFYIYDWYSSANVIQKRFIARLWSYGFWFVLWHQYKSSIQNDIIKVRRHENYHFTLHLLLNAPCLQTKFVFESYCLLYSRTRQMISDKWIIRKWCFGYFTQQFVIIINVIIKNLYHLNVVENSFNDHCKSSKIRIEHENIGLDFITTKR